MQIYLSRFNSKKKKRLHHLNRHGQTVVFIVHYFKYVCCFIPICLSLGFCAGSFEVTEVLYLSSMPSLCVLLNQRLSAASHPGEPFNEKPAFVVSPVSNKPVSVSLAIKMYPKTYVCPAFVSFTSRSDSSSFLDKVGLVCGTDLLRLGGEILLPPPPPPHWQLGTMAH